MYNYTKTTFKKEILFHLRKTISNYMFSCDLETEES